MLEKPDLSDEKIIACLRDNYGLSILQVKFLPLGADMNTAVYRVTDADHMAYFLKLRLSRFDENSVLVPRFLVDQGITSIINPMSNQSGQLWTSLAAFTAILYPFVIGKSGVDFTPQQWVEFGATLHSIHSAPIPDALRQRLPVESWSGHWRDMVRTFMARVATEEFQEAVAAKLAALLNNKRPVIEDLVARAERLAGVMQARLLPLVLCHSDIHMWNCLSLQRADFILWIGTTRSSLQRNAI